MKATISASAAHLQANVTAYSHSGHLHGVEVIDYTTLTYNGSAESFVWRRFGFKIHFPDNALPSEVKECQVYITASLSGQFLFPEDTELISGIYWIICPQQFVKPVTVEVQHCATKQTHRKYSSCFKFIVAKHSQKNLPYQFKILDGAFAPNSQYGSIKLTQSSGVGIVFKPIHPMMQWLGLYQPSHQPELDPRSYCARLYYSNSGTNSWEVHFSITWSLELHMAVSIQI